MASAITEQTRQSLTASAIVSLSSTRRIAALAGVGLLLLDGFLGDNALAERMSTTAYVALVLAAIAGLVQLAAVRVKSPSPVSAPHRRANWLLAGGVLVLISTVAVQTWFEPNSMIAGGDLVDHVGVGWLKSLFAPWTWGGSTLGEPSQLPSLLPWASILGAVTTLGGDAEAAQRIWYTLLFVGAGLSAFGLLSALRLSPPAAATGACAYLFNPYVLTWVSPYDVYMAALVLVAALPAAVVAAGTRALPWWLSAALIATSAPLLGFTYQSPPLVGMVLGVLIITPLVVVWTFGRSEGILSSKAAGAGLLLLCVGSAYWVIPAMLHVAFSIPPQYQSVASWAWTESRATIRNAFWLNTHWGWTSYEFFPYARSYGRLPLSVLAFVLPAVAFAPLAGAWLSGLGRTFQAQARHRLEVAAAVIGLFVLLIATGTNAPGSVIFDPLYALPFGWLLREPPRFLMFVGLMYGVLIACATDEITGLRFQLPTNIAGIGARLIRAGAPLSIGAAALLLTYPMVTGAVVPDTRPTLPTWAISARPTHVNTPDYWIQMAGYVDQQSGTGALLVLPPDDWYQMPYTWYYGADAFLPELFTRRVLVPTVAGYTPASEQLVQGVNIDAESILDGNWRQTMAITRAMGAQYILVRGDIDATYPNHSILSPASLAEALSKAPDFSLARRIGPLDLFRLNQNVTSAGWTSDIVLVDSTTPDWRLFQVLDGDTKIVDASPKQGLPFAEVSPPLDQWNIHESTYVWSAQTPAGWTYRLADLARGSTTPLDPSSRSATLPASSAYSVTYQSAQVTISAHGRSALAGGGVSSNAWGRVGDCNPVSPDMARDGLNEHLVAGAAPDGTPSLELAASLDSACVSQPLEWLGGPVVISLLARQVRGLPPRICVWETGPNRCASMSSITPGSSWVHFHTTIFPDLNTTSLTLYLYADADQSGDPTIDEYANVGVDSFTSSPNLAVLAEPVSSSSIMLLATSTTYSSFWAGPSGGIHVLVDGITNGWLTTRIDRGSSASYRPTTIFYSALLLSAMVYVLMWLAVAAAAIACRRRFRQGSP